MATAQSMSMSERWAPVPEFPAYKVSTFGRIKVKRHRNGMPARSFRVMSPACNKRGYPQVRLVGPAGSKWIEVHRLVWECFNGPVPHPLVVRHKNDPDPKNCRLDNLAIGTQSDNCFDKDAHGTAQKGEKHPLAKLTNEKVREIRAKVAAGGPGTAAAVARELDVSRGTISRIISGKGWRIDPAPDGTEPGTLPVLTDRAE